jgi:copper homeostasis protein
MAFDQITDKLEALDILINLGVNRILTRGGKTSAIEGKENLKEMIDYCKGRIIILPGGGLTKENYPILQNFLGCNEFHGTKIV